MTTEALLDTELDSEEDSEEVLEQPENTDEDDNPVVRKSDLAALNKSLNDLSANVGRLSSMEARLKRVEDPATRTQLESSLRSDISATKELITSVISELDDSAFSTPETRRKLDKILAEASAKAEWDDRERKLLEKVQPQRQEPNRPEWITDTVTTFEEDWADRITDEGFDPDSAEFKAAWQTAGNLLRSGRTIADARNVMKAHLKTLKDERAAARARNNSKKNAGGGAPRGGGAAVDILNDPLKTRDEKAAYMRSIGIQVG